MTSSSAALREAVDETYRRAIAPDPDLLVWEWAEQHRVLPSESPEPGPKSYDRTPYLRFIAECLSPRSPYERIVLKKGSQVGFTDLAADWLGHTIHLDPSTVLCVWPTVEFGQRKSRELIDPLIESCPPLRRIVAPPRAKDAQNTILVKRYAGGRLIITGANSGVGLRSTSSRRVFLDELDAFVQIVGKEGDPVHLALRATMNFKGRRKILIGSTPLLEATSLISREFNRASRACEYHVPCPTCGAFQPLRWERMRYRVEGKDDKLSVHEVHYRCEKCDAAIRNHDKAQMLPAGRWADLWNSGLAESIAFHLSALYAPVGWYAWDEIALRWERAKGNPGEEQTFKNMVLGEAYAEPHEAPKWEPLYQRREPYREGDVQPGCRFLTLAIDVQRDRLEVELKGWGREGRGWSLLYRQLVGDPLGDDVWAEVDRLLTTEWPTAAGDGTVPVWCCAVDAGNYPERVFKWARTHRQPAFANTAIQIRAPRSVMVVVGRDLWHQTLRTPTKVSAEEKKRGLRIVQVGVSKLKLDLYRHLRLQIDATTGEVPPGYRRWPDCYDDRYFKGLVAEHVLTKLVHGQPKLVWELPPGTRNEPLDLDVYNRAAAAACGLDRMTRRDWERIEARLPASLLGDIMAVPAPVASSTETSPPLVVDTPAPPVPPPSPVLPPALPPRPVVRTSGYQVGRWAGRTRLGGPL